MLLWELFDDNDKGSNLEQTLKDDALDILMPFAAHGVPFITVQNLIDKLGENGTGLSIDRALIMNLLNPDEIKIIKKIEGDKIFLNVPETPDSQREVTQQQKEKDHQKTMQKAQQQAKKQVTQPTPAAPAPQAPPPPQAPQLS